MVRDWGELLKKALNEVRDGVSLVTDWGEFCTKLLRCEMG